MRSRSDPHAATRAAEWIGVELPEDFKVDIWSDFAVSLQGSADLDVLLKATAQGVLSPETWLKEAQRRAVVAEDIDASQEAHAAAAALPPLE